MIDTTSSEAHVLKLVQAISPYDSLEQEHIDDIAAWIKSGAPLYRVQKPDVPPKHLVSYFVVVDPKHNSILLADHIKAQLWLPSGGHVEKGEDPKQTVVREAKEELSMDAVFLKGLITPFFATVTQTVGLTAGHTDVSLWYVLKGSIHDRIQFDRGEFTDIEWFTFDEILESSPVIFDPHLPRFVKKLQAYLS